MPTNDKILPLTRAVAIIVIPFLLIAFCILYFFPGETERLFAWNLRPTMTAMMLGATYAGGIYFFSGVLLSRHWHHVKVGFLPVAVFAGLLGIATILHWDKFNHEHIAFFAWAGLYFSTPFLVLGAWLRNRYQDPGSNIGLEFRLPLFLRIGIGVIFSVPLLVSLALFLAPEQYLGLWPWKLSPLTARVMASMFSLPGVVGLGIALDARWGSARIILQSQAFSIALILLAAWRAWGEFDQNGVAAWLFVGGLGGMLVGIVILYVIMEARARKAN